MIDGRMREMPLDDLSRAEWRVSSYTGGNGDCVELAGLSAVTAVRDSKNPDGGTILFGRSTFARLLTEIKHGQHDL